MCKEFRKCPKYVAMMDRKAAEDIKSYCIENNLNIEVYSEIEGLEKNCFFRRNRYGCNLCCWNDWS